MPSSPIRQARETLDGLQGLRGLAAVLVVVTHAICTLNHKAGAELDLSFAYSLGRLGVQVFFAVSGLTMMLAHGNDFRSHGASRKFALRRLGRIVPLYWITSLIYYVKLAQAHAAPGIGDLLLSLSFVPHQEVGQAFGTPVYGLGWTLQFEMFFYSMFAVALFAERRAALIGLALLFAGLAASAHLGLLPQETILGYLGSPIVLFFVAGIGIGVLRNVMQSRGSLPWGFRTSVAVSALAVGAAVAAAAVFGPTAGLATAASVTSALVSVAACGLARPESSNSAPRRLAKALGDSTYALYLTHSFILGPAGSLVGKIAQGLPPAVFVLVAAPLCIVVGWLVYKYVDGPISKRFGKWLNNRLLTGTPGGIAPAAKASASTIGGI